jgi:ketosteroid isomerase-like protein
MKNFLLILLAAIFPFLATAQTKPTDDRTTTVLKIIEAWDAAYMKKDAAPLEKLLAENYIGIDDNGEVTGKSDEIALIKNGEYVIHSVEHIDPPVVRFYEKTAIVTTHSRVSLTYRGKQTNFVGRATTICHEKQSGHWQITSWHASKVEKN